MGGVCVGTKQLRFDSSNEKMLTAGGDKVQRASTGVDDTMPLFPFEGKEKKKGECHSVCRARLVRLASAGGDCVDGTE